jgi:hypothetical protein
MITSPVVCLAGWSRPYRLFSLVEREDAMSFARKTVTQAQPRRASVSPDFNYLGQVRFLVSFAQVNIRLRRAEKRKNNDRDILLREQSYI